MRKIDAHYNQPFSEKKCALAHKNDSNNDSSELLENLEKMITTFEVCKKDGEELY